MAPAELTKHLHTGLTETLGLQFEEVSPDRVVVTIEVGPHLHQPHGIVHGGVYTTIVEAAASIGAGVWYAEHGDVVGVSNQTDFLRAVRTGRLTGVATPVHRGRSQQLWSVDISDDAARLVARGQVRLANLSSADRLGQ